MILVRSPLRVSLGGGGTDLCSYYSKYEGFLVAAAIDKYVYISVNYILMYNSIFNLKYNRYYGEFIKSSNQ